MNSSLIFSNPHFNIFNLWKWYYSLLSSPLLLHKILIKQFQSFSKKNRIFFSLVTFPSRKRKLFNQIANHMHRISFISRSELSRTLEHACSKQFHGAHSEMRFTQSYTLSVIHNQANKVDERTDVTSILSFRWSSSAPVAVKRSRFTAPTVPRYTIITWIPTSNV